MKKLIPYITMCKLLKIPKIKILTLCVILLSGTLRSQAVLEAQLILQNSIGQEDTLYFGVAHGATRYVDTAFNEINILGDTAVANYLDARFSDRFAIYDENGNHHLDSTGHVKMGISPVSFESKRQFIDPWADITDWFIYYEINIKNEHWPLSVSSSIVTNSLNLDLSSFVLTTWADASRWFDVSPRCGGLTLETDFINGSNYQIDSNDFCRFQTETGDSVMLLFIGITKDLVGLNELSQNEVERINFDGQKFIMDERLYGNYSDWKMVDAFGSSQPFEAQCIGGQCILTPNVSVSGFVILYSPEAIIKGLQASKGVVGLTR